MSVANRLYGFSDAPVEGASPFWGTLEVGAHDTLQMLSAFTWAVGNRTGSTELTERAAEAFRAEEQYGQEAISELGYGQQKLLAEPIGLANFSPATLGAQLLRNMPSMAVGGAAALTGGLPAGALAAGALGTGDAMSSIVSEFGNLTPEDAAQIPYFKKYIAQGMTPEDALQAGIDHAVGNQDILQMALQTGLGFVDPAVWLGRMARGGAPKLGMGRIKSAVLGTPVAAAGGAVEEGSVAYTQNVMSERTEGLIPETSIAQAALAGAILEGPGGAVAGFLGGGKPWETVEPGQLDQNEQAALTGTTEQQLALPPPGPGNQPRLTGAPQQALPAPAGRPPLGLPAPPRGPSAAAEGEVINQPGRTAQPTAIRDVHARPPATPTPDVIEQPGRVGPVPAIAPPGGRPASLAPDVIPLPDRSQRPPTLTPEQVEQSVEDFRQNAIQNGAPEGPELEDMVESYRADLINQLEEEAAELQERTPAGAIPEEGEPIVTAPVTMRDVTREFLNQNGVSNEELARLSPEQTVDTIVRVAEEQLRLRGGMTEEIIEQRLALIREQATDEIVNGNVPVEEEEGAEEGEGGALVVPEEEGPLIEGEAIPEADTEEAIPEQAPVAPPARPRRGARTAAAGTGEVIVPPEDEPPQRVAQPTVIQDAPVGAQPEAVAEGSQVADLSPEAAAINQRLRVISEEEQAQEAARARGRPVERNPVTISEWFSPIPESVVEAEAEGPITVGIAEGLGERASPEGQTVRRGGQTFHDARLEAETTGVETREDSALRKELDERYPEFKGRTDLSVAQIQKRVDEDPVEAADVLAKNPPAKGEYAVKKGKQSVPQRFVKRLERILKQAKARDITLPKYVTATTPDSMVWLADVQRTLKQLHKNLTSEQSIKIFGQYIGNETAALDGDFEEMRGTFGRGADIGGTMPGGGGPIETLAGGIQSATEEEAEAREIAEAADEETEEAAPIVQTYEPGAVGRAATTYREPESHIYVEDEETGEVRRVPNPELRGYEVEASEEEKQRLATETATRAAELTRLRHDKSLKPGQDVKGQKSGRSGKGVSAASEEEYVARPGKKISAAKAKDILAEEGKKPMTKKARAEAKRKLAESKAELERKMAAYRETVTRQDEPEAEAPKQETKGEALKRRNAEKKARLAEQVRQSEIAREQEAERSRRERAGKETYGKKLTFEERAAAIFAEIEARKKAGRKPRRKTTSEMEDMSGRTPVPKQSRANYPGLGKLGYRQPWDAAVRMGDKIYTSSYGHVEAMAHAALEMGFDTLEAAEAARPDIFDNFDEDSFGHIDDDGNFLVDPDGSIGYNTYTESRPIPGDDTDSPMMSRKHQDAEQQRQAAQDKSLQGDKDAVDFFGHRVKPVLTLTLAEAVKRARAIAGVRGGPFRNAHDMLVDRILQMLAKSRPDMPVYVLREEDVQTARGKRPRSTTPVQGFYGYPEVPGSPHPETGFIGIKAGYLNSHILAHEGIHAITQDLLATFPALRKQLEQLLARIMVDKPVFPNSAQFAPEGSKYYGLESIKEMLSEIVDPRFAELLHTVSIPRSMAKSLGLESWRKATAWNGFVAAIRKYFNEMLGLMGLQPINDFNAFEAVLSTVERAGHTYDAETLADYQSKTAQEGSPLVDPDFMAAESEFRRARERVQRMDNLRRNRGNASFSDNVNVRYDFDYPTSSLYRGSVNAQSATEIARAAGAKLADTPGKFRKFGMKLRSGDNIMRQFEHLFPTGVLRRGYSAYMRRYTLSQQMHGEDAKFMNQKNNLFHKYANKKIGNVTAKEFYESVLHDQSNWNVDASKALKDNTWLYNKDGTKINLRNIVSARMHPELKKEYDQLVREAPELARMMQREFKYYKDKHQRMVDGILSNHIIDAAKGTGHTIGNAAALSIGRRIMSDTHTPADVAMVGKRNFDRIRHTPEFRAQQGPYTPQTRYGDHVVSAKVRIADPTSGSWKKQKSPQGDITIFYGPDAEKHAINYASKNGSAAREEYSEIRTVWTDARGNTQDAAGNVYTAKDVITGAVKSYRVMIQDNHVEFFESESAAKAAIAELKKDTAYYKSVSPYRIRAETGASPAQELAASKGLKSILEEMKTHDPFEGLPPKVRQEAMAAVQQAIHRATPGTSISKRRMARKHVAGASRDSLRVMHSYSMQANNFIAGIETAREMHEAFKDMEDYAEAGRHAADRDNVNAQVVVNELSARRNEQAGIHGGVAPWVNFLTGMQFTDKLASPGYSITNMTQTPLITLPTLAKEYGLFNAGRALTKAMNDIGFMQIIKKGGTESLASLRNRLEQAVSYHDFVIKGNPKITGNRVRMLDKLVEYGSLDPDAGFEASKLDSSRGGVATNTLKRFEELFRQFPRAVEAMNRYGSAIAAYDLSIKKGNTHEKAVEDARDVVDSTQFNYSPANVSPYFNTAYGSIGLQFAKYGTFMYQLLGAQVSNAFGKTSTRAERISGLKGLAYLIGAHYLMAGFGGLPLEPARGLVTLLNMMGVDVDWADAEAWVRDVAADMVGADAAEILTRGLPRMVGWDFSTRTSLADLLISRPPEDFDERQNIGAYLWQLTGGPTGSSLTEMGEGIANIIEGNVGQGLGQVIPLKLFTDIESAVRIGTTGKMTSGRDVIYKYTPWEMFTRGLGIRPAPEGDFSEARNTIYRRMESRSEGRSDLMRDYYEEYIKGGGGQWKFQQRFNEYNADKPRDQWITFSEANKFARDKARGALTYKKGVPVTKGNEQIIEDVLRTFGN